MCRIAIYTSLEDESKIKQLYKCFRLGTLYDFVLDRYRRGRRSHNHGWGYAYIYGFQNDMGYSMFKTSLPILSDGMRLAVPRYFDWILMIIHSRLTSGEPIDVVNAHPYSFSRVGRFSMWFVHNGSIDKEKLSKDIGLENFVKDYSDSFILTQWLGMNIKTLDSKDIVEVLYRIIDLGIVKSALNIAAIVLDEMQKKVLGVAVNYVTKESADLYDYYSLHIVEMGSRTMVIASSTIALYLNKFYKYKTKVLDNGTVVILYPTREEIELETLSITK